MVAALLEVASHIRLCEPVDTKLRILLAMDQFVEENAGCKSTFKTITSENVIAAIIVKSPINKVNIIDKKCRNFQLLIVQRADKYLLQQLRREVVGHTFLLQD